MQPQRLLYSRVQTVLARLKANHNVMMTQTSQNDGISVPSIHTKSKKTEIKEINQAYQTSSKGEVNSFLNNKFSLMKSYGLKYRGKQLYDQSVGLSASFDKT
jgi:hypothetical protein